MATKPELFIVESLDLDDEENGRQEGQIIAGMLRLSGKVDTQYYYIRTERELDEIIKLFVASKYRYLHISCHANRAGMATTFDSISYRSLSEKLTGILRGRRIFVSACQMANNELASGLLKDTGCYSLVGPHDEIAFDDSAAFWVAFYHLMFKIDDHKMKHRDVEACVDKLSTLFEVPINYFRATDTPRGFKKRTLQIA
ncbi:hypothetical protein [Luteibacter sp.]|uniref:hypothetical protein n=1 Tax=Luteibacter sp. TaxID=1886636 RepID=UPI003F7E2362